MALALERKACSVDVHDTDEVRTWLMDRIRLQIKLRGEPLPVILLLAEGHEETLSLDTMAREQPDAHVGATFQLLRTRPGIERAFTIFRVHAPGNESEDQALLFEEIEGPGGRRRWWCATLPFEVDPTTGSGLPAEHWVECNGETDNPAQLWPLMRELAAPPLGSRPAEMLAPRPPLPDLRVAFDALPESAPAPSNSREMVQLAGALAVQDLLDGRVKGTVVVRLAGRVWEQWVLSGEMPSDIESMVRYIANSRQPPADGVAVVQIAIRPDDDPPAPAMQVIAELGGMFCETWAPIEYPEGPKGPRLIPQVRWWDPRPVPEEGMWLGVDPMVLFDLGPIGLGPVGTIGEA